MYLLLGSFSVFRIPFYVFQLKIEHSSMKTKYNLKAVDQQAKKIVLVHLLFLQRLKTKEETNFTQHLLHIYYSIKTWTLSGEIQQCRNRRRVVQRSYLVLPWWLESTLKFKIFIGQHVEDCYWKMILLSHYEDKLIIGFALLDSSFCFFFPICKYLYLSLKDCYKRNIFISWESLESWLDNDR